MSADRGPFVQTLRGELEPLLLEEGVTLVLEPKETLKPATPGPDTDGARAVELLRRVGASEAGLQIMSTIGEGGMGVVRAARQLSLGREVALKTLRESDPGSTLSLLREAWITGSLEHPNVVPVYDVSLADDGRPQIVLKKIEGASWSELLGDEAEVARRFGANDALDWHLRTLMQVANALHFAHSRNIIHRDIKPDNVMIGRFGEVYVLDWGVAVSLVDDGTGRLPLIGDAREITGTPAYMAPEMLGASRARLGVCTDVYLLGAVLHEVLVGKPPHDGKTFAAIIESVLGGPIALPDTVPPELADIVRKAMAVEPGDRYADAQSFRLALVQFLEHRGSLTLTRDADERLRTLDEARARPIGPADERHRAHLYRLFTEARMGYWQALRAWPGNEHASLGLRSAVEGMIAYELSVGDPRAATALLGDLTDPSPALRARVERARAARERADRRRAALEADHDPEHGGRVRLVVGGVLCFFWAVTPISAWFLEQTGRYHRTHRDLVIGAVLISVVAGALAWWGRDALSRTAVNRTLRAAIGITLGSQLAFLLAGWALHVPLWSTSALKIVVYGVVVAHIAVTFNRWFWAPAGAYAVALALDCSFPQHTFLFEGLSNVVLGTVVVLLAGRSTRSSPLDSTGRRSV